MTIIGSGGHSQIGDHQFLFSFWQAAVKREAVAYLLLEDFVSG